MVWRMPESAVNTRRGNIQPTALSESSERLAHILQHGAANITLSPRPTHPQPQHTIHHTAHNKQHTPHTAENRCEYRGLERASASRYRSRSRSRNSPTTTTHAEPEHRNLKY